MQGESPSRLSPHPESGICLDQEHAGGTNAQVRPSQVDSGDWSVLLSLPSPFEMEAFFQGQAGRSEDVPSEDREEAGDPKTKEDIEQPLEGSPNPDI